MTEKNPYISVMIESLNKKKEVLDEIIIMNEEQTELIQKDELDLDAFGKNAELKEVLVKSLTDLDDGFQTLFDRVSEEIKEHKESYREEILLMQKLIKEITDKSMSIQAEEARNKLTIEGHFSKMKREVKTARKTSQAATNYYKNMSKLNVMDAQFMDRKK